MARQDVAELEWQTRKRLIDPKLEAQGWKVSRGDPSERRREAGLPTMLFAQGRRVLASARRR